MEDVWAEPEAYTRLGKVSTPSTSWCIKMLVSTSTLPLERLAAAFKMQTPELQNLLEMDSSQLEEQLTNRAPKQISRPGRELIPGTRYVARYKGSLYTCEVLDIKNISYNGGAYTSLSAAGCAVTGRPTCNGWSFWSPAR